MMNLSKTKISAMAAVWIAAVGCSGGGGEQVRTGTPAYYWKMGLGSYGSGDYAKANEWLEKVTSHSANDYTGRAWAMRLTLMAGIIRGNAELSDEWEKGANKNKSNPMRFFKRVSDHRGEAARRSLEFAEAWTQFEKAVLEGNITIQFPYPSRGDMKLPPQVNRIQEGTMPKDPDIELVQTALLERGMLEQVCDAAGAPGDPAKAQSILKTLPVEIPRKAWMQTMAETLYNVSTLYGKKKMSDSLKQDYFLTLASKALAAADAGSKEAKELKTKIEKDQKDVKSRRG